jgi:hypothetical protein
MTIPRDPLAIVVMVAALAAMLVVAGSCIGLLVAYAKREKVIWGRRMRTLVGIGGTATSIVVLLLPPGVAWLVYLRSVGRIDEALHATASDKMAPLLAHVLVGAWNAAVAACLADLVLLLPCAVLAGLALTVPFFLRDRKAEVS